MKRLSRISAYIIVFTGFYFFSQALYGQGRPLRMSGGGLGNIQSRLSSMGGGGVGGPTADSLEHRNYADDSLNIYYRLPVSTQSNKLDSSISDFTTRFPVPADYYYLGNLGNAAKSYLYTPEMKSGWDHGFHSFDIYKWKLEEVRFFNTTKPYTELGYLLGSKTEQMINVMHTQNIKPNWNFLFQYRLINSPGLLQNLRTNHNNYLLSSWFQSKNKRYNNYFVLLGNKLLSSESGGIKTDKDYLNDPVYDDRFNIPTKIGGDQGLNTNFFSNASIKTANKYNEFTFLVRQQFDLGRKDSLVTDSTVIPLFYPRLRFEHTFSSSTYRYRFYDYVADSGYYAGNYGIMLPNPTDTVRITDKWKEIINDFSIYQFPDANNLQQFIKLGVGLQNLTGTFDSSSRSYHNFFAHGEYRNKTKNKKWDMLLEGNLYINGLNAGDYDAMASLRRISAKTGAYLELAFKNTNRTPSYTFNTQSSFYLAAPASFNKENISCLFASVSQPRIHLRLTGRYFLVSNMTYYKDFYQPQQEGALFNVLQLSLEKMIRLGKHWNWYTDIYVQQKTGAVDLNVPFLFTRQRIALEGLFFTNLNLSTGLELRYHTPYKADNYSPVLGSFFFQDTRNIANLPFVSAFLHMRIRSFKAYVRLENLNTITTTGGFGFRHNNFVAPDYIFPGLQMRLGILWNFVN